MNVRWRTFDALVWLAKTSLSTYNPKQRFVGVQTLVQQKDILDAALA